MDTVWYAEFRLLRSDIAAALATDGCWKSDSPEWRFYTHMAPPRRGEGKIFSFSGYHEPTGVRVEGSDGAIKIVKASLPRVLHGSNAICLKYTDQEAARRKLDELITSVSGMARCPWNLKRWDFAIQIRCHVPAVLAMYRFARTRLILGSPVQYVDLGSRSGHGQRWTGKFLSLTMYDKGVEINSKTRGGVKVPEGVVLRIEVSLKNQNAIEQYLPQGQSGKCFPLPDYFTGWRIFRAIVTSLEPNCSVDLGPFSLAAVFAFAEHKRYSAPDGRSIFEWWSGGKNPDTVRKMRKLVQGTTLKLSDWSFEKVLPLGGPPDLIDIADGKLVDVPTPFASYFPNTVMSGHAVSPL